MTLSLSGCKSMQSLNVPFFFLTGTTRAQYGDVLTLIIFLDNRSSVISLICSFLLYANRLGIYAKVNSSFNLILTE